MNRKIRSIITIVQFYVLSLLVFSAQAQNELAEKKVGPQPDGSILVPTNQLLRPAGFQINLPGRPVDLALSPDEKLLFVKNRKSLDIIRLIDRTVLQSLPYNRSGASFTGLCLSWFSALAKQYNDGRFDGRNELSCKIAGMIQEKIIDKELNGVTTLRCI